MFTVIGTTTIDLFISGIDAMPQFDGDEFTSSSLAWCSHPLTMTLGGNGANSAYVLATLGAPTALCSAVGQDDLSQIVVNWLASKSVDLRGFYRSPAAATPTTTAITDQHLNRISFHHPGPTPAYCYADIPAAIIAETSTLLITGYTLLNAFRLAGVISALRDATARGALTALDIGPLLGERVQPAELLPMFPHLDYLIMNERELMACVGTDDFPLAAHDLVTSGAPTLIVKRARTGAVIVNKDGEQPVAGFPVDARVTVGAGDSFNAAFLFAFGQGKSLVEAVRFGNATASLVLQSGRGVLGAPSREQVENLLRFG